jgi:phage/plasmid-associated DNA primase
MSDGEEYDYSGEDLDEEEVPRASRRRDRDAIRLISSEYEDHQLCLDFPWPVYIYRGAVWFTQGYKITGVSEGKLQAIGWTLLQTYAKQHGREFLVRIEDTQNNVLFGSYRNRQDYVDHFVEPLGEDPFGDTQRLSVDITLRCQERESSAADLLIFDTKSHLLLVKDFSNRLLNVKPAGSKRRRRDEGGPDVDDWDNPSIEAVHGGEDGFAFGDEQAFEVSPMDKPCRLTVTLENVDVDSVPVLKHDVAILLRLAFDHASDRQGSGFEDQFYNDELLAYHHNPETRKLVFVYADTTLYFANTKELARFWDFCSKLMVTRMREHRLSELVTLRNDRNTFIRKFGVDQKQFDSHHTMYLTAALRIPVPEDARTHGPSRLSISSVDLVSGVPVDMDRLSHLRENITHTFTLKEVVEVVKRNAGLEHVTTNTFLRSPIRNRILIAPYSLSCCLYVHPHWEHDYPGPPPRPNVHRAWLKVDLDNVVHYDCICRHPADGHYVVGARTIKLGNLRELSAPEPIGDKNPLRLPNEIEYPYGLDEIAYYNNQGIADYLACALHRRILYSDDGVWYIWTGKLWCADKEYSHISDYLTRFVPRLLNDYLSDIPDDNKKLRRQVEQLRSRFCSTLQPVRMILTLLSKRMYDPDFEESRRHRGLIAAQNGVIDLRSGILRDYRAEDYITECSPLNYIPCDCEPGMCFEQGSNCNATCFDDMLWIDNRMREINGQDLKHVVWRTDDGRRGRDPKKPDLQNAPEYWRDHNTGEEYASHQMGTTHYRASLELAFERNGLANYDRFRWSTGYILTGFADLKLFIFGYGEQNNGKTLIWNNLVKVFKQYLTTMSSANVFARGGSRQDDGPTPAIIHVLGKRGGYVPEMSMFDQLNDSSMKKWAGRDQQVGRKMRSEMFSFDADLVAVVNGNIKPKITILDPATWDRFHLLYYPINYLRAETKGDFPGNSWKLNERPRVASYIAEFKKPGRQLGLFNWGIRQATYFMNTEKCPEPELVKKKVREMKNRNNPIPSFIDDCNGQFVFDADGEVRFKVFHAALKDWCKREGVENKNCKTPSAFRSLIIALLETDATDKIALAGQVNTDSEVIKGIRLGYAPMDIDEHNN